MRALPQAARTYLAGLWSTALLLSLGALFFYPRQPLDLTQALAALIFVIMLIAADMATFEQENGHAFSIAVAVLIAGITSISWPLMLVVAIAGTIIAGLMRDLDWWQIASIVAVRSIGVVAASAIALLHISDGFLQDKIDPVPYTSLQSLIALIVTGASFFLIERVAEGVLEALSAGQRIRQAFQVRFDELSWYMLMLAPLGGLLAILYKINGFAFVLGIVPVIVVQRAFQSQSELIRYTNKVNNLSADSSELNNKLERLQSLMVALISIRDVPAMLELLCNRLGVLMNASNGWVVLLDDQQQPTVVAAYNLPIAVDLPNSHPVPHPNSYTTVLGRQRVMMFTDQYLQTLAPLEELAQGIYWNALVCIPLVDENRVMGAICLTFAEIRGLAEDEQRILMAFARQAATVIANARLLRRLQESQAELIQSSKLAAVGTFAAGIAHEFNNLLAGMLGYAQLGLASPDDEGKNESLQVVVDTCKRGKSITGSLLTFARRQEPRRELADLYDAVQGTLTLMEIELRKHNINVVRELYPVPPTVCDAGQISQVFLNLLTNARDAMKPAGGTLTVNLDSDDKQITLRVSDTGHGIPESLRDKIFEPFVTTKGALGGSATPGTGLGLSVSYGIVKSHGGAFVVESEEGKGTTMTITIPVVESTQEAAALAAAGQEPEELPSLRLLIVDDDISISRSLQGLLEHLGHKVTISNDGANALDLYRARGFDIVLTDLAMPGMNGMQLLRELRAYDPDARVLIFTGQAFINQVEEATRAGALAVLRKPFELEEVLKAMRSAYFQRRGSAVAR